MENERCRVRSRVYALMQFTAAVNRLIITVRAEHVKNSLKNIIRWLIKRFFFRAVSSRAQQ